MTSDFAHLDAGVREVAALPAGERIRKLSQPHWIGYTRSKHILDRLEDLLQYPRMHRMPNLLIVGETNNGKTVVVSRFQRLHAADDNIDGDHAVVPVLLIQAPPAPDENRFYGAILEALAAPYKPRGSVAEKQVQVVHLLRTVQLRLLIVDEIHHILAGHIAKQRYFLNVPKHLGNELQIPLVGVGTMDAVRAIHADPQMVSRFEPVALPRWGMNRDFQTLLASFERILPQRPSGAEPNASTRMSLQKPPGLHLPSAGNRSKISGDEDGKSGGERRGIVADPSEAVPGRTVVFLDGPHRARLPNSPGSVLETAGRVRPFPEGGPDRGRRAVAVD